MPPACPVDTYALSACSRERNDPPGKPVAFNSTLTIQQSKNECRVVTIRPNRTIPSRISRRPVGFPIIEEFQVPNIDVPSEAVHWEQELADLLNELSDVQHELLELLAAKRQCMAASQLEEMSQLQPREQATV